MNKGLTWKVRRSSGRGSRQKAPVVKAYFYWKRDGRLVRSAQFTQTELEVEIERLSAAGRDITQFVLALERLALSQGSLKGVGSDVGARMVAAARAKEFLAKKPIGKSAAPSTGGPGRPPRTERPRARAK